MHGLAHVTTLRRAGAYPALVLNADYRPLSTFPVSVWPWETSIHAVIGERVNVVAEHDRVVRSPSVEMKLPSVVVLRDFVKVRRYPAFTRHNVLLRDKFCCAYCGHKFETRELTFDHVVPRAQGGKTRWENILISCGTCNVRKGNRTPSEARMPLLWRPWRPTADELGRSLGRLPEDQLHNGWRDYLYWDSPLDE